MTRRVSAWWVPLVTLLALLGSGTWLLLAEQGTGGLRTPGLQSPVGGSARHIEDRGSWAGRMMGGPMVGGMMRDTPTAGHMASMRGLGWFGGRGRPVTSLSAARDRAARFAAGLGPALRVGEVMRFTNHYYAEIQQPDGTKATEVLVHPGTGVVQVEYGPAMMWNTRYGMMRTGQASRPRLTAAQARTTAQRWLDARDGLTAGQAEAFPGYFTLHTLRDGRVDGMLSVHAVSGSVWYHAWHGRFLEMDEAAEGE